MDKSKPFGLIITKRGQQSRRPAVSAVFGSDSDDEPSGAKKRKMPSIPQAKPKKQLLPEMSEDPSIYEYDSIYDDMKAKEVAKVAPKDSSKPSRYIGSLLKAADKRKKDQERRVEKKVHNERELEGDKFADKEAFVTSAYKKKMQEMEEEEERERRENMLNEMMDVTKQKDLSGFYRHFLKQSVGEESVPVFGERYAKKEQEVAVKEEKVSDEEASGSVDSALSKSKKNRHDDENAGSVESVMPRIIKTEPVVKRKKPNIEEAGSAMPGTSKEEKTLDRDVDRDTDMDTSSDDDNGKVAVVGKSSNKKDEGNACRDKDIDSRTCKGEKVEVLDGDVDRDTDMDSSSDEDNGGLKDSAVGKSFKKGVLTKKPKSLVDDNVDRDTDIESSSDEEALDEKVNQRSKDTQETKKIVHIEKSSSLVDNVDKDSDSSGEDESCKPASCSPSKAVFKKPSAPKDFAKKRPDNSGKQHRNIRKRAEDVDSSPDSDEPPSTSDDETSEEPKANGGSKEGPIIPESVEQVKAEPLKPKIDIFAKRTVGDVFADAQVRYFQRMAARSA